MLRYQLSCTVLVLLTAGCQSPYFADRGAALGGLAGAGLGAIVGHQSGHAGAGAAIGAGVGALTGAVAGQQLDEVAEQNRAEIAAQMGQPVGRGAVTNADVVAMTRAAVAPVLIVNHINTAGIAQPVSASDVIWLHQQGVSVEVIQAMQSYRPPAPPLAAESPVIVEEHHYGPPPVMFGPPGFCGEPPCGPRVGWSVSVGR